MNVPAAIATPEPPGAVEPDPAQLVASFREEVLADVSGDGYLLPALPVVVTKLRRLLADPDTPARRITALASTDPALSTHLLRIANSAFYAGNAPVADLGRAIVRLGTRTLNQALLVIVVAQMYNMPKRHALKALLARQWRHATQVATLSQLLCKEHTELDAGEATLAGMIHDVGALPLMTRWSQLRAEDRTEEFLQVLIEALHAEVGEAMLRRWEFPDGLVEVVSEHEDIGRVMLDGPDYVDLVTVANLLAHHGTAHRLAGVAWHEVSALRRLDLRPDPERLARLAEHGRDQAKGFRDLLAA